MGKFGWAYIGCGGIAVSTAKELAKGSMNEIVAVWNRTESRAMDFAAKFGGRVCATPEEAINTPGVEGVYIALTADKHAEFMKLCIKNHKPVLCEKPFTVNHAEADEVFALARQEGVYVSEAMWTWHNATALKVKEWLDAGEVGKVREVRASYAWPMLKFNKNPRLTTNEMIGGALMDIGIYPVTYAYRLFGMPERIVCAGRTKGDVDLAEYIQMVYPGFTAGIRVAFDEKGGEYFDIVGTKGTVHVPMFHMAQSAVLKNGKTEKYEKKALLYDTQFSNVAREIRAGLTESRMIPMQHTLDVMALLDECRRQMGVKYPSERSFEPGQLAKASFKAISHVGFNVRDIEKSLHFYCDILGCSEKFTLTYGDMADDIEKENKALGTNPPFFLAAFRKQADRKWSVYVQLPECESFIELFDQMGVRKRKAATNMDMGFTHFSLEVNDIQAFRQNIIDRSGREYLDTDIKQGLDNTLQMWMHDPDGNLFEIMEYTSESYQVVGRI